MKAEKRKQGRQAGLLSFEEEGGLEADEEAGDEAAPAAKRPRMRSAHDAAQDPRSCLCDALNPIFWDASLRACTMRACRTTPPGLPGRISL